MCTTGLCGLLNKEYSLEGELRRRASNREVFWRKDTMFRESFFVGGKLAGGQAGWRK